LAILVRPLHDLALIVIYSEAIAKRFRALAQKARRNSRANWGAVAMSAYNVKGRQILGDIGF
jgi:hypothetical protein